MDPLRSNDRNQVHGAAHGPGLVITVSAIPAARSGASGSSGMIVIRHHRSITWLTEPATVNHREELLEKVAGQR